MRQEPRRRGLGQPGLPPHGPGGTQSPGPRQAVRSESSSPGHSWGDPQIPASCSRGPSVLRARSIRPESRGKIAPELMTLANDSEPSGGPSLTTFACALKDLSRSSIEPGPRIESAATKQRRRPAEVRQGRRAFTTDSRGGLSQWHGGRLGRHDSWDGPRITAVVESVGAISLSLNILMTGVSWPRALGSA